MAFRPSPLLTLRSAGVQPAFGSWVTAVSPTPGFAQAAYAPLTLTLGNAASSGNDASQMFKAGEDAWLINVDGSGAEQVRIAKVTNNTVILGPKTGISTTGRTNPFTEFAHAAGAIGTGTFILPKQMTNNVLVTYQDGSAGPWLYIGSSPLFTVAPNYLVIYKIAFAIAGTQPPYWNAGLFSPGNPIDSSELFVLGTTGDQYFTTLAID